jgi:hypothetical protein
VEATDPSLPTLPGLQAREAASVLSLAAGSECNRLVSSLDFLFARLSGKRRHFDFGITPQPPGYLVISCPSFPIAQRARKDKT